MLYLKVKKSRGEEIRERLLKEGSLDKHHEILREENFLYFPLKKELKIKGTDLVKRKGKKIKKKKTLPEILKKHLTKEEISLLPSSFDVIGDILILELDKKIEKKKKEIGKAFLEKYKNIKVVLQKKSEREGEFRLRNFEILAGEKRTETLHKEYNCLFKLDVKKVYFSPREAQERQRILKQVKEGEEILVMFSGIAPYAIQIAKRKNCQITCIEKNSFAFKYAQENLRINKVEDKIKNYCGDVREIAKKFLSQGKKFSRLIMPLPKGAYNFLDLAIPLLKRKGLLHFYHWGKEENLFSEAENLIKKEAKKFKRKVKILEKRKVLPYSPRRWKIVLDVEIF